MNWKNETERIVKFLKDYNKEAGTKGYVLGLSGGLDSAVVATLLNKAFPWRGSHRPVSYVFMPVVDKDEESNTRVWELCMDALKVVHITLPINKPVLYIAQPSKIPKGNVAARIRMVILYYLANSTNSLVCGTTNKSEYMLGYFTKFGDGGVDVDPIQHLYKTEVFELAEYLGVPQSIIDAKPSAGLWEGQTDEDEIGLTYATVDTILKHFESYDSNCGYDIDDAGKNKGLNTYDMQKVFSMISQSEHKRRMPRSLE